MTGKDYSFRLNWFTPARTYRLEADALHWTDGRRQGAIAYASVVRTQSYKVRYWGSSATYWRCVLHGKSGETVRLQAAHYLGVGRVEDRTALYLPFIKQLETRVATANPAYSGEAGRHWLTSFEALVGVAVLWTMRLLRYVNLDRTAACAAWLMRRIGPRLRGHRAALENLRAAFPEKSSAEIDAILLGMWDNMARIFVEYAHLERIWDYDPQRPSDGRIVVDAATRPRVRALIDTDAPGLIFGGHLANWELLVWAIGLRGPGRAAVVYHPPKDETIDQEFARIRSRSSTTLIPANSDTLVNIKSVLNKRGIVGILVDEHFSRGSDAVFFGRPCKVSPVLALFARQFECPIYGSRMVRLPGGRFRLDVTDPISPPRDENGRIDVARTMQLITSMVEDWVREHPEQWNWMQRRWR